MSRSFQTTIAESLQRIHQLRCARTGQPGLAMRLLAVKHYQHARFSRDYAALRDDPRYSAAVSFFLEDLYGPGDYSSRDAEFGRVVPAISRLLPKEVLHTVCELIDLHALSEELDQQMASVLVDDSLDEQAYRAAWHVVGRRDDRGRQLDLLLAVGAALERHTRSALLGKTLRLMRAPARAGGLARLQSFLERGLAAFVRMHGAADFLRTVESNERRFINAMFSKNASGK